MSNKNTILVCSLCNEQYQAIDLYACSATYCPSIMCDKCVGRCAEYVLQHKLIKYTQCHKKDKFKLFASIAAS